MYQICIVLFCLVRSIVTRYLLKKSPSTNQQSKADVLDQQRFQHSQGKSQTESENQMNLKQLKQKKHEIESTMQQYNNPSSFAKYSKMQRQLTKMGNQILSLEQQVLKQKTAKQQSTNQQTQSPRSTSLFEQKKGQVQALHKQVGNKTMLIKALTNFALIYACSYFQSSQISLCAGYPLYAICNEQGRVSGAWVFVISTVCFSH